MKEVKITIDATIRVVEYCSHKYEEEYENMEDAFFNEYYSTYGLTEIEGLYLDEVEDEYMNGNEDVNLIKKKGKYVKTKNFFHDLFKEDGDHPLPVEIHVRDMHKGNYVGYTIELEDDEEFDITKLQLVKSDYEHELFPYFIIADYIIYDGKEIGADAELWDYGIEGKYCNIETIESLL